MLKRILRFLPVILLVIAAGTTGYLLGNSRQTAASGWQIEPQSRAILDPLDVGDSERPQVAFSTSGMLYLLATYRDQGAQRLGLALSSDGGDTFSGPVPISAAGVEVSSRGENGPSLAQQGMSVFALWQQSAGDRRQILFSRSLDMGRSFGKPVSVTDKTASESSFNGFSSMTVAPNGDIYVVWLDGRAPSRPGTFSVYLAKSTDRGATFSPNVRVAESACPCCRPAVAVSGNEVYVGWRSVFPGEERDIVVATSLDGGQTFGKAVRASQDHWVLHACPEAGPSLAVLEGQLFVSWHTAADKQAKILLASSPDHGQSFGPARLASGSVLDANHPVLSVAEDGRAVLVFQGRDSDRAAGWEPTRPYLVSITPNGNPGEPVPFPSGAGSSAYPDVVAASSGRAFVAWTQHHGSNSKVTLSRARFHGF